MQFKFDRINELLEPLNAQFPCGIYLKTDNHAFRALRNEFNFAQAALRKLVQNPDAEERDRIESECYEAWSQLSDKLFEQFCTVTRDIELIGWFITSQLILDRDLDSIANSFTWLSELAIQNWAVLNPVLPLDKLQSELASEQDSEQSDAKIKAFSQLLGDNESSSLLYIPLIFQPMIGDITFSDYQSAERKGKLNELKQTARYRLEEERQVIKLRQSNVSRCLVQLERLEKFVSEKKKTTNASTSANFSNLIKLFSKFESALQVLSGFSMPKINEDVVSDAEKNSNSQPQKMLEKNDSVNSSDTILNRDFAFHQLRDISCYFRNNEPHSPVSYLLEKTIRWGYLSLPELFKEMLAEQTEDAIVKVFNVIGANNSELAQLPALPQSRTKSLPEQKDTPLIIASENNMAMQEFKTTIQEPEKEPVSSSKTALNW